MKKILLGLSIFLSIVGYAQQTDVSLTAQADVIRNETVAGANTKGRIADMFQSLIDSKTNIIYGVNASGTDTYSANVSATVVAYVSGQHFHVKFTNTNTGPSTISFNFLGTKALVKNVNTALSAGDIPANRFLELVYDGTNFQIIGPVGVAGGTVTTVGIGALLNGVSASVTNPTTTPAINISLGEITPNSVASVGTVTGSNLSGTNTGDQTLNSLLPTQTGNSGEFLTTDGTNASWAAAGSGSGTVTDVSVVTANGFSGSVATSTTTPAITIIAGAITPTSVNGVVLSGTSTPMLAVTGTTTISGTNTGDQTSVTGNSGTATALQTARTINGTSFDGTGNITVTAAAGTLTGTTLNSGVVTSSLTAVGTLTNLTVTNPISGVTTGNENLYYTDNTQTGSYTLVLTDANTKRVLMNVAGSNNLTVPPNSSVAFPVGTKITVERIGAGQTTIVAGGGVTLTNSAGNLLDPGLRAPFILIKTATDTWDVKNGLPLTSGSALTTVDDTNVILTAGGSPATALLNAASLTVSWSGSLSVARGGIGNQSIVSGDLLYGDGTGSLSRRNVFNTTPTALLHLKAGTATASTAPLKFSSGTNLTTFEAGAVEYDGTNFFASNTTARYTVFKGIGGTGTMDFNSIAANTQGTATATANTITCTGAAVGDEVVLGASVVTTGVLWQAQVTSTNTVSIVGYNITTGAVDPASTVFKVTVLKR